MILFRGKHNNFLIKEMYLSFPVLNVLLIKLLPCIRLLAILAKSNEFTMDSLTSLHLSFSLDDRLGTKDDRDTTRLRPSLFSAFRKA